MSDSGRALDAALKALAESVKRVQETAEAVQEAAEALSGSETPRMALEPSETLSGDAIATLNRVPEGSRIWDEWRGEYVKWGNLWYRVYGDTGIDEREGLKPEELPPTTYWLEWGGN